MTGNVDYNALRATFNPSFDYTSDKYDLREATFQQ